MRDAATGDAAKGAGVYLWHCDRDGNYSLYSQAAANENYLRGAQEADAGGTVTFQSIFPACYSGRWPHISSPPCQGTPRRATPPPSPSASDPSGG